MYLGGLREITTNIRWDIRSSVPGFNTAPPKHTEVIHTQRRSLILYVCWSVSTKTIEDGTLGSSLNDELKTISKEYVSA